MGFVVTCCLDLSDILDVPDVVNSVEQATPLYSITLTTRHLTQARLAGSAVVTRKKCHQTGLRTLIAGPWTPIKDDTLFFPEDRNIKAPVNSSLRDYLRIQFLAGRQGIDKPWRPCFTACEDNTFTCWPKQNTNELSRRLFYFGNKESNRNQRQCLKWTEDNPDAVLQIFYYNELNRRLDKENKLILNRFYYGGGRLLHSEICLDLARLIEHDKTRDDSFLPSHHSLDRAYRLLYDEGPGCFSWIDENKLVSWVHRRLLLAVIAGACIIFIRFSSMVVVFIKQSDVKHKIYLKIILKVVYIYDCKRPRARQTTVEFTPCFYACPCGSTTMRKPFLPYRAMCEKEKYEYEPCIASRDVRNLRHYDEEFEELPEFCISRNRIPPSSSSFRNLFVMLKNIDEK
ncbi:hypothetical protein DICVIV_12131 [Dictyocaulus viviparus]|uniref:Uncharacterized protein n=1 Tax=Dictyocaulus viviparus TaxID=29172 RepID=A0A0D8XB99_DICVI|nr:hypothetical protein DICVIV_12131 [Dictyocaulus viviparus]